MPKEYENKVKPVNPEMPENTAKARPIGENFVSELDEVTKTELINYAIDAMKTLQSEQDLEPENYFGYTRLIDWAHELNRCFNCLMKPSNELKEWDYRGFSRVVTPEFKKAISIQMNSYIKMFQNISEKFTTVVSNPAKVEAASLAKALVQHSMQLAHVDEHFRKPAYWLANHGYTFVKNPLIVKDYEYDDFNDYKLDKEGRIQIVGKEILRDKNGPSWKKRIKTSVYNAFIPVNMDRFLFDPTIEDIKDNPFLAEGLTYSRSEWEALEDEGEVEGLEDWFEQKDYESFWDEADTHEEESENKTPEDIQTRTGNQCYFYHKDLREGTDEVKRYVMILGNENTILGIKEYIHNSWRFLNATASVDEKRPACPSGLGQTIYSSYLYLNTRYNQAFDIGNLEALGGGIADKRISKLLGKARPGKWTGIPGFEGASKKAQSWREILGTSSNTLKNDVMLLKDNIQGAMPSILGGNPTGTLADRAGKSLQLLATQAESLQSIDFINIENKLFRQYAEDAYSDYILYFKEVASSEEEIMMILVDWLGEEKLKYKDSEGKEQLIDYPSEFPPVDFRFMGASESMKKMEKLTKLEGILETLTKFAQVMPEQVMVAFNEFSLPVFLKKLMEALDVGDLDEFFPTYNPAAENARLQQQLQQVQQDGGVAKATLQRVVGKLQAMGTDTKIGNEQMISLIEDVARGIMNQQSDKNM